MKKRCTASFEISKKILPRKNLPNTCSPATLASSTPPYGSFTLHGIGTGTRRWWVSILRYVLYTLHRDRDRHTESLFSIVSMPFPIPVPVPCSVYEPLAYFFFCHPPLRSALPPPPKQLTSFLYNVERIMARHARGRWQISRLPSCFVVCSYK